MKTKISKILGVLVTLATLMSIFVSAIPVGAAPAPQTWTEQKLPGSTGYVMPNDIVESGPIAQAADGTLYVYVKDSLPAGGPWYRILKSTNGGRTWAPSGTSGQPTQTVTALVAFGTSNVYYTTGTGSNKLFRSTDGGATFINIANAPVGGGDIISMDVGTWSNRNIIIVGTTTNVFYVDESDPFFSFQPLGTPDFATAIGGAALAVKVSAAFGTDRGVAAVSSNGIVSYDVLGGAWGAIIGSAATIGAVTSADIHFPADWNAATFPNFYFATNTGVYQFRGALPTSSTLLLTTTAALPSSFGTPKAVSLDVSGNFASATIFAGLSNMGTKSLVIYSTNAGGSWSTPSKLYGPGTAKAYVVLANDYATSGKVFVLVGGTGLTPNDQSGFSYSVDKGVSFNQISLINDSVSVINDLAASSGTTFVSTSYTGGSDPTSAITAGTFTITAGSRTAWATDPSSVLITVTAACDVVLSWSAGSWSVGSISGGTYNTTTYTLNFTGAGSAVVSSTYATGSTVVGIACSILTTATVTTPLGGALITGLDPNWSVTLPSAGVLGAVTTDTTAQIVPAPAIAGITVVMSGTGTYDSGTGIIDFNDVGETAKVTNAGAIDWAASHVEITWGNGAAATTKPKFSLNGVAETVGSSIWSSSTFTLIAGVVGTTGTNRDSIWRWDGTWFERVFLGGRTLLPTSGTLPTWPMNTVVGTATMVRVSSAYATDKTVFYAAPGGIVLSYSTNNGQTWRGQLTNIGYTDGYVNQIQSLLVVDGNTQYVGSVVPGWLGATGAVPATTAAGSRVIKTSSNGIFWSETVLKDVGGTARTGAVTDVSVASNGDLFAVVTDPANTYAFKSTDAGVTFNAFVDPNLATNDAWLASSTGAWIDAAADYATTGNVFVTLGSAGGVYRFVSTAATSVRGWLRVDGNTWDANGNVGTGSGMVVAAGGPGATAEGSGMIYATDASGATEGVSRIRGLSTQAEALDGPVTFTGLWASSVAAGNVQLWTIGGTSLYTYVDTLGVAGSGVTNLSSTYSGVVVYGLDLQALFPSGYFTNVIKWNALPNAVVYRVYITDEVNDPASSNLYATTGGVGTDFDTTATQLAIPLLAPNTTYFVSVWAKTTDTTPSTLPTVWPCSSFRFNMVTFTTAPAVPNWTPNLSPMSGANNVPVNTSFDWDDVVGATSYEYQIAEGNAIPSGTATVSLTVSSYFPPAKLKFETGYMWRVRAMNGTVPGEWVTSVFTTAAAPPPVVTVPPAVTVTIPTQPPAPTPTINLPQPTVIVNPAPITITIPPGTTLPAPTLVMPEAETPVYIWIIVAVGALLTIAVIVLIIRTRRVV
jgi:hypothetical protein